MAQVELERNQIGNKKLHNTKAKKIVFQVGNKVLVLLPTDHNKLLTQWKVPFEVKGSKGENNYQIKINRKMKTFYINLLKQYVERDNVEMTSTPGRRDFPRGESGGNRSGNWNRGPGCPVGKPQAAAVDGIAKVAVGASADCVKEEDFRVDNKKMLELGVLRPKESISVVYLGVKLSREQQNEIMAVLGKREKFFTDISGETSIIDHKVHLIDDRPSRCKPHTLPYAVRGEIQK